MALSAPILSGSTDGLGIKVAATSSPGTTIHTAVSGGTQQDRITLYCYNSDSTARELVLQWGGTTAVDNDIKQTIPPKDGLWLVADNIPLQNGLVIKAYCATTNVLVIYGSVRRGP